MPPKIKVIGESIYKDHAEDMCESTDYTVIIGDIFIGNGRFYIFEHRYDDITNKDNTKFEEPMEKILLCRN